MACRKALYLATDIDFKTDENLDIDENAAAMATNEEKGILQ